MQLGRCIEATSICEELAKPRLALPIKSIGCSIVPPIIFLSIVFRPMELVTGTL